MRASCETSGKDVVFRLSDIDPKYVPVLQMCFYQQDGDDYIKTFSADLPNMERIISRFENFAPEMFDQLGYFREVPWEAALEEFILRINPTRIRWWLTGSCSACIRGIPLSPHDVDIMIDSRDVDAICELFSDCFIEPLIDTQGWVTKDFGVLFLKARIDIASDPSPVLDDPDPVDCGPYALAHLEEVQWHGHILRVPPLQLLLNVNLRRERLDRVELIQKALRS
ncbi:MAG TPA: hypothetical protein PL124_07565 [Candidatus Cloacimonadota bacterium]|nr:hypothetical protein [Candidatus Cloacimonadota bacterium]